MCDLLLDLQLLHWPVDGGISGGVGVNDIFNLNHTVWAQRFSEDSIFDQATVILPVLLRPKSRGSVILSGPSIHDHPIIDANFLDHPKDIQTLVEGMKFLKRLEETEEFRKHDMHLWADQLLCGNKHDLFSDAYFECYVREYILTVYHPASTCRMGPEGQNSVVDHRLRVHGIEKLRVVDASIMPNLIGASPHAACIMIGEKGASMILEDLMKG